MDDFSFHQGPTSNLLRELRDFRGVEVIVLSCQPESIPAEMHRGLSPPVERAVAEAARMVWERWLAGSADGGRGLKQEERAMPRE